MNCPKCKMVEMRVEKVVDNQIYYKCKKCGEEEIVNINEIKEMTDK